MKILNSILKKYNYSKCYFPLELNTCFD